MMLVVTVFLFICVCVFVSGAGLVSVSVRHRSLNIWMETGVHGASGACAAEPVVLELDSGRGSAITLRKPSQIHRNTYTE